MSTIIDDQQALLQRVYEFQQKFLPESERTIRKTVATGKFIGFVKNKSGMKILRYL